MNEEVIAQLKNNRPFFVKVINNMTPLFKPLNLTVNGQRKKYMKDEFTDWYSKQIENNLHASTKKEDIGIQFKLITITAGTKIIVKRVKSAGINDTTQIGKSELQSIDPCDEISTLVVPFTKFSQLQLDIDEELYENHVNVKSKDDDEYSEQ